METLKAQVQALRDDIARYVATGELKSQVSHMKKRAVKLLLSALRRDEHPIHERLKQLKVLAESKNAKLGIWIAPLPGHGDDIWPLQLLLLTAVLDDDQWQTVNVYCNAPAERLRKEAFGIAKRTIGEWAPQVWANRLSDALQLLVDPHEGDDPYPRLEGADLVFADGRQTRLQRKQLILVQALFEAPSQKVTHAELRGIEVKHVCQLLSRLQGKLLKEGLPQLDIRNHDGEVWLEE